MIDSIIELSLISSIVAWLNLTASQSEWQFTIADATYSVSSLPKKLIVDHSHTTNGAAGTAFVVVALGRLLALCLRHLSLSILALFLTTNALIYIFTLTNSHTGQRIDTLELSAVLRLDLVQRQKEIRSQLAIINSWQYNLIVMFLIQLSQTVLALVEYFSWRNHRKRTMTPMIV
ncbi:hypothetical protein F5Y16DRAFT_413493 [Xylariaceae sp. FL0255]|nr:hypothetical protein F5Y16DRAFT_413493 [Xylariaceae sp. FL0255]